MPWWIWALLPFAMLALLALWVTILEAIDAYRARKLLREIERKHKSPNFVVLRGDVYVGDEDKAKWI